MSSNPTWESFKVESDQVLEKMKELLHEGNVRRIVIKQGDRVVVEIPLTVGAIGALIAPWLAAAGALAAYLTDCTIDVERTDEENQPPSGAGTSV
jgi:hypothetical protein